MKLTHLCYRSGAICLTVLLVQLTRYAAADPPSPAVVPLAALRSSAVQADEPETATKAFARLFEHASDDTLVALKADPDLGISLHAAYLMQKSKKPELIASSHPERFIGFLEGRTGLSSPPNWAISFALSPSKDDLIPAALRTYGPLGLITIEDEEVGLNPGEGIPMCHTVPKLHRIQVAGRAIQCPLTIDVRNDQLVVSSKTIPLRESFSSLLRRLKSHNYLNAIVAEGKVFVVIWEGSPLRYPIICLDLNSGEMLWKSEVWAVENHKGPWSHFGHFLHHVELTANQGMIGVFGISHMGYYVEGFTIGTGKAVFRFSPNLWFCLPE